MRASTDDARLSCDPQHAGESFFEALISLYAYDLAAVCAIAQFICRRFCRYAIIEDINAVEEMKS
jgi:hypothetical protein